MMIVLGMVEMSRALDVSTNLTAALREGGRLATMDYENSVPAGMTINQKIVQDIRNMIKASGLPGDQVTITITHANGAQAGQNFDFSDPNNNLKYFKLTAQVNYSDVGFLSAKIMSNQKVTTSLVFRMGRTTLST